MPGDYMLELVWPTCSFDNQKCPSYLSRCDQCTDRERRISVANVKYPVLMNRDDSRRFKDDYERYVPYGLLPPHEEQAKQNHGG